MRDFEDIFKIDWAKEFSQHDWKRPFLIRVMNPIKDLVKFVEESCRRVPKKEGEKWRASVGKCLSEKIGLEKWNNPVGVPLNGEIGVWDVDGNPIVAVFRQSLPLALHDHINKIMSAIWNFEEQRHSVKNEGAPFRLGPYHYTAHPYGFFVKKKGEKKNTFKLYKEVEEDLFKLTLPYWLWVDKFYGGFSPKTFNKVSEENPHGLKIAGSTFNGLAFNFASCWGHRDQKDIAAALLSYYHGPHEDGWTCGAFVARMIGLKIPVRARDNLIYDSRLWHEVEEAMGTRFGSVSYAKKLGSKERGVEDINVPLDFGWITDPLFGWEG